jgi:hypothetical protein
MQGNVETAADGTKQQIHHYNTRNKRKTHNERNVVKGFKNRTSERYKKHKNRLSFFFKIASLTHHA